MCRASAATLRRARTASERMMPEATDPSAATSTAGSSSPSATAYPVAAQMGPTHGNSVRGVNLMRVRNGHIVEALPPVLRASSVTFQGAPGSPLPTGGRVSRRRSAHDHHSRTSAPNAHGRDAAVETFAGMVERARKCGGCLSCRCWRDQQSLNAWRKVTKAPKVKRPETCVKLHRSDKAEKPF